MVEETSINEQDSEKKLSAAGFERIYFLTIIPGWKYPGVEVQSNRYALRAVLENKELLYLSNLLDVSDAQKAKSQLAKFLELMPQGASVMMATTKAGFFDEISSLLAEDGYQIRRNKDFGLASSLKESQRKYLINDFMVVSRALQG